MKPSPARAAANATLETEAVSCDATSCDYRTETCCESAGMGNRMTGCVSKTLAPSDNGHRCYGPYTQDRIGIECLSSADCPNRQSCCAYPDVHLGPSHCAEQCEVSVACVPGDPAGCRAGFRCHADRRSRSGGMCLVERPTTSCGGSVCTGATPGCCYDASTKQARCVAITAETHSDDDSGCARTEHTTLLQCTSPADCGGEHGCTAGGILDTSSSGMCMSGN